MGRLIYFITFMCAVSLSVCCSELDSGVQQQHRDSACRVSPFIYPENGTIWSRDMSCSNSGDWTDYYNKPCDSVFASNTAGLFAVKIHGCKMAATSKEDSRLVTSCSDLHTDTSPTLNKSVMGPMSALDRLRTVSCSKSTDSTASECFDKLKIQCAWKIVRKSGLWKDQVTQIERAHVYCSPNWKYHDIFENLNGCQFHFTAQYVNMSGDTSHHTSGGNGTFLEIVVTSVTVILVTIGIIAFMNTCGDAAYAVFIGIFTLLNLCVGVVSDDGPSGTCELDELK